MRIKTHSSVLREIQKTPIQIEGTSKMADTPTLSHAYLHTGGTERLLGSTVDAHLRKIVARYPDNDAFVSIPHQRRVTYAQLDRAIDEVACSLMALGLERGARVGIWSTDNLEWLLLQMATARTGIVLVNINPSYRTDELAYALELAQVQALFLIPNFRQARYVEMVHTICPEIAVATPQTFASQRLPALKHLIVYQAESPMQTTADYTGFWTWQDFLALGPSVSPEALCARSQSIDMDDPINIQFTTR